MSWDNIWETKRFVTDFSLRWQNFLSKRGALLTNDVKILEAGCGSGEGLTVLVDEDRIAVGLDLSEKAIRRALLHRNVLGVQGNNFALPFPDDTFDIVFNSGVIEHFKYPENLKQVKEMARVTKHGGEIIINVPNSLCLWYILIKKVLVLLKRWQFGYEESYTLWRLERTAKEAGLRVISTTGFLAFPPLATNNMELLPFKLRKKIAVFEEYFPFKQYYAYSVCIRCKKK